ncbi:MAG: phage minor head protein [Paracoccaceae bacterium]
MPVISVEAYRRAFGDYIRTGAPIRVAPKEVGTSGRHVWRTRRDDRVRLAHRINDGHLFDWTDPPVKGHPGEAFGCRCVAVPYVPGETEFAYFTLQTGFGPEVQPWTDLDFVNHYCSGAGRTVRLEELGHLQAIAEQYAYRDGDEGVFHRLAGQIASNARQQGEGAISHEFRNAYDFGPVAFSHGCGVVRGYFSGVIRRHGSMLAISGRADFFISDRFGDPVGPGIEVGGAPYAIVGNRSAEFVADVFADQDFSAYAWRED